MDTIQMQMEDTDEPIATGSAAKRWKQDCFLWRWLELDVAAFLHNSGAPSDGPRVCKLFGWCGAKGLSVTHSVAALAVEEVFGR